MGITKTHLYDVNTTTLALALKAISHPARLSILKYLIENSRATNKELVEHLGLSQATTSMHIKELRSINLICATAIETYVTYAVHQELIDEILLALPLYFNPDGQQMNCR